MKVIETESMYWARKRIIVSFIIKRTIIINKVKHRYKNIVLSSQNMLQHVLNRSMGIYRQK